jgi:hypothetical protein
VFKLQDVRVCGYGVIHVMRPLFPSGIVADARNSSNVSELAHFVMYRVSKKNAMEIQQAVVHHKRG